MVSAVAAEPRAPAASYGFHCSACGRCCNSPPALTAAEMFHHADRFVGCLAIRRDADGRVVVATQGHDYPSLGACPARDEAGRCGKLASESAAARARCAAYAERQVLLIEQNVAQALRRRHAPDRPFTEDLRRFAAQYRHWLQT